MPEPEFIAHETAVLDEGCQIGTGSRIWHFTHIMPRAILGKNCNIGQNVFIADGVVLGNNVKVQNNVSLYTGVTCEDDVFLGPSMVFTNVMNPRSAVNRRGEYQHTIIRKGVTIGANATIICGIEIGAFAFIGAGSVVTKNVKPYELITGNPGRSKGWMSEHGCKLMFDNEGIAICRESGIIYHLSTSGVRKAA